MLPKAFTHRMQEILKEEYPEFIQSYEEPITQALRLNPLKGESGRFLELSPFLLTPLIWEKDGYYYGKEDRPGKHPYHEAGVYYIQEASAMLPAHLLEAQPGERVLDLCAAPGGKSTRIGADMAGEGVLICNEIHPGRAKSLSENIERMGIVNAIVVNHSPDELAKRFPQYFHRILVDAPCSGEGMFRKNPEACKEWSPENVHMCTVRQDEIMEQAAEMLVPGGRLVYSTCTFAPEENEGTISRFLHKHPDFFIVSVPLTEAMSRGQPAWMEYPAEGIEDTIRLWPHRFKGEGHFAAVLQKTGTLPGGSCAGLDGDGERGIPEKELREYAAFKKEYLKKELKGTLIGFGEQLYLLPEGAPVLKGLRVLRPGLHLGTMKKNRFEPAHALALSLQPEETANVVELGDRELAERYLCGQTFKTEASGWCLLTLDGYSLGWGKAAAGTMKNHYPKGLRKSW